MNDIALYNPTCQALSLNADNYEDYIYDKISREAINRNNYEYSRDRVMHLYFDMLSHYKEIPNISDLLEEIEMTNIELLYNCADIFLEFEPMIQKELSQYPKDSDEFAYTVDSWQADFAEMNGDAVFDNNIESLVTEILVELGVSVSYDWNGDVFVSTNLSFLGNEVICFFNDCQNVLLPNFILDPLRQSGSYEGYYSDELILKMSAYRRLEKKHDGSCNT